MGDEALAAAVDEVMAPVVDELWAPIGEQVRALYADLGLVPSPLDVEVLIRRIRLRAEGEQS